MQKTLYQVKWLERSWFCKTRTAHTRPTYRHLWYKAHHVHMQSSYFLRHCTCPAKKECYHILAAKLYMGIEVKNKRRRITMTPLRRNLRPLIKQEKGTKRPAARGWGRTCTWCQSAQLPTSCELWWQWQDTHTHTHMHTHTHTCTHTSTHL